MMAFSYLLLAAAALATARLLDTLTPQMGWNSYNHYGCYPNEDIILDNAQGLVDHGLAEVGYVYLTVDCGWPAPDRDAQDRMVWNPSLFPSGVEAIRDGIHDLGLKFGVYSGGGFGQCGNGSLPASLGYEQIDAESFADWGADSLKYDNCFHSNLQDMADYSSPEAGSPTRFVHMAEELDAVDRDIMHQVCQWGCGADIGEWAPPIGNSYRISNDIYNDWRSIWRIANQVVPYAEHTGPGSFPDMDMLIVGLNVLSEAEERFHFTLWAIAKSPLIIGLPLTSSPPAASLAILTNEEALAINQDSLAQPARLVRRYTEEQWDIWAGPLSGDRMVVAIANWNGSPQRVAVDFASALGVSSASARDVWAGEDIGTVDASYEVDLGRHELQLLVLSNIQESGDEPASTGYHGAPSAALSGANLVDCPEDSDCAPTKAKITNITPSSSVTFSGVEASSSGTKLLAVDYINYDVALGSAWGWGTNTRNLTIAVNDGDAKRWAFPLSGGNWYDTGRLVIEVDGFQDGENRVVFKGSPGDQWGPDLVGVEVLEL